ncbi:MULTISPECIES: hypothetical protein [Achromobacter]|uniref:hypothetical protein n=1 Tax=Achromobacter TaxID=222 RepID=UPI0025C2CC58|nr:MULTISPECIES: hypothetical protein [Achromobacter]
MKPTTSQAVAFGHEVATYLSAYRHRLDDYNWGMTESCIAAARARGLLSDREFGGGFAETLELRQAVAQRSREIQAGKKGAPRVQELADLAKFVISDWGGLNGNDEETIEEYASRFTDIETGFDAVVDHESLRSAVRPRIRRGLYKFGGIASWSKWLSFVWNDWALIYDARIAFALDAIHFIRAVNAPVLPVPPGRNGLLASLDAESAAAFAWLGRYGSACPARDELMAVSVGNTSKDDPLRAWLNTAVVPGQDAYAYYLELMAEAHRQLWQDDRPLVQTEMLLFKISITEIAQDFIAEMLARFGQLPEVAAVAEAA